MIENQSTLTADALKRGIKPEALCVIVSGDVIQVTSWPFFEGEGDERSARIMARKVIDDPMSNLEYPYFAIMKVLGTRPLQPPFNDGTDPDKPVPDHLGGFLS